MDSLRGNFGAYDASDYGSDAEPVDAYDDTDAVDENPPPAIGRDERRMQVRAYNFWASLIEDRNFPSIEDLAPDTLSDFGPFSVLLDFTTGMDDPSIAYVGEELSRECATQADQLPKRLSEVPPRSLLSRITDHYMQILANQSPIGFEAEFVNSDNATILYRGILLPFSSDDESIDFIYGVINWKEMADSATADELLLEIDQALEAAPEPRPDKQPGRPMGRPMTDWADGPGAEAANDSHAADGAFDDSDPVAGDDDNYSDSGTRKVAPLGDQWAATFGASRDDTPASEDSFGFARPSFGLLDDAEDEAASDTDAAAEGQDYPAEVPVPSLPEAGHEDAGPEDTGHEAEYGLRNGERETEAPTAYGSLSALTPHAGQEIPLERTIEDIVAPVSNADSPEAADASQEAADSAAPSPEVSAMNLADWLAAARNMAQQAKASEERTRSALYDAIGRAWDFALAAQDAPEDFAAMLADAGIAMQDRAPMTPVAKLVFGADYDKTRLTEYAAALAWAQRNGVAQGSLAERLQTAEGGLKGVVAEERAWRRGEDGEAPAARRRAPRKAIARKLRAMTPRDFSTIDSNGEEFALVMIRRTGNGEVVVLGEVPEDVTLIEKAARQLFD